MVFMLLTLLMISTVLRPLRSYENLSRRNFTVPTQSSTYSSSSASLANDGDLRTTEKFCAHTAPGYNKAWFQVDFGRPYNIHSVKIYYRKEGNETSDWKQFRFRQFYLDVSDLPATRTTRTQRTRCYTDNTTAPNLPPNIINIPCKHTARYVIVETTYDAPEDAIPGAFLEICEIEVYGCSPNCLNNVCNDYGNCTHGCVVGYWGQTCESTCPVNCREQCDKQYGRCSGACTQGYWREGCNTQCSVHCSGSACDTMNGICFGCVQNWTGDRCESLVTRLSKHPVNTASTDTCIFITSGLTVVAAGFVATSTEFTNGTRPLTLPRVSATSLRTTTTGVVTGVSVEPSLTAQCTGTSVVVTALLNTVNTAFTGTNRILRKCFYIRQNSRQSPVNKIAVSPVLYNSVENNTGYQELGQISGPSLYDQIKKK